MKKRGVGKVVDFLPEVLFFSDNFVVALGVIVDLFEGKGWVEGIGRNMGESLSGEFMKVLVDKRDSVELFGR